MVPEKRAKPLHPPFVAIFPVLAVYSANTGLFPLHDLFRPAMIAVGVGMAVWMITALLSRSFEKGALIASFLIGALWVGRKIGDALHFPFASWILLLVALGVAGLLIRRGKLGTPLLNRFAIVLVVISAVSIGWRSRPTANVADASKTGSAAPSASPDVFVLLLDGYGRADQLKRVMGWDNQPFLGVLRDKGFKVLEKNRSNYCQTALSLGAMLNLDYVQTLLPTVSPENGARDPLIDLVNRPKIVRDLRTAGYESIAVTTGFPSFEFQGFDLVISDPPTVTYFESVLLDFLPIDISDQTSESQFEARRKTLTNAFTELKKLTAPTARPRFVFAHIIAPHPPFVFDGEKPAPKPLGGFNFFDGSDYMTFVGNRDSYTKGYRGQLAWVNARVEDLLRTLTSRTDRPPIILIQGDHGSKRELDQNDRGKTDLDEAMSPIAAYYVPKAIGDQIDDSTTPVNVMRLVAEYVTGRELGKLPDKSYYSPFAKPYAFSEVD